MIILFEENEVLFQTLGLGILRDVKSCKVKETLNDAFELEMTYPITGSNFSKIKLNRILFTKYSPYKEPQPFRIYSISKPINGVISVKAFHISYDMNGIVVAPISGSTPKTTLDEIQNKALTKHNFVFYSDLTSNKTFKTTNYYNMRALLMGSEDSVLEKYDGDIYFDKFNVYLLKTRGSNKGASIRYAKNLKDITHDISYDRLYNGVYPFYHQETQEVTTNVSQDGFKQVYIVGTKPYQDGWLSYTNEGEPYHPIDESPVQIATEGDYYQKVYAWNPTTQRYVQKIYNEMVNLFDWISGALSNSDKPSWIYVDLSGLPNLVIKTTVAGYYKLSTETEWTHRVKGEVVFQGTIKEITSAMMMYYSEVIPTDKTATETETTSVTHVELDNKIMYLDTDAAKEMKFDRILALDLTSEFDETPDKEKLEAKAKEYIEKNKIGQYKYDTRVSFVDLSTTTDAIKYEKIDTIELGDVVKVVYEDSDINIDLRVISTTYDAILDRYENIELGEKPEKLSASSVQTGDNISSLSNDVGYTDITTVNKLIAKTVTADLIQAKNANLSKAQIEELQTARIKITGMIEATQFEIDTLVAKLLTADNAVIKQTLEAGTVKVKGDITVTSGAITIESTASGTVFKVDRDGNVTANSVNITGGELNINNNFSVTPDGIMTAIGADIRGRFEAESGSIAGFTIESLENINGNYNALYSGTVGSTGSVLMSPGYSYDGSIAGSGSNLMWAFIAGTDFGVTTSGTLYAKNAEIYGTIHAKTGNIGGFDIRNGNLEGTNVIIGPSNIKYGNNEQFVVNSNGAVTIQNRPEEGFDTDAWDEIAINEYSETMSYSIGDVIRKDDIFYICKDYIVSSEDFPTPFDLNQWDEYTFEQYDGSKGYSTDDLVEYGWKYYKSKQPIGARQSLTLNSNELVSNNLKAKYAVIEDAKINSGTIASFTIEGDSIYSGISSMDYKGNTDGVYIGPDGLRLGKNLKIFPDGRIMSGSKNYDPSLIYRNGEYCTYEDSLYKCIISVTNVYIVGETPFASDWLSLTEGGEALTPDNKSFYKIVTEGDYKNKVYKWNDVSEKYSSEKDDPYTTGEFDQDVWEKVDNTSFGVDDLGHLTAQSATIIGHIEAGSGYIGNKENGFMITSKSIQNGFTDGLGNIQQTGVYIGTDAIRLGRGVGPDVKKDVNFGNLTSNNKAFGSIESEQAELLGCEFQLTYNQVSYNRYIEIREMEDPSAATNDSSDYVHINNPSFKPITVRDINGSEIFSVKKDEWTFITFNDPSLYTDRGYDPFNGAFRGQEYQNDAFLLNVGTIVDGSVNISVIYFATENDWKNDINPITPISGAEITVTKNTKYASLLDIVSGVFKNNAGPWVKIKIKDDSPEPQETTPVYIVGETPLASDWLSLTEGGEALIPEENVLYEVLTAGEYYQKKYRWNNIANQYSEAIIMDTSSDISIFESCTAEHNSPKVVLLPANTSSISITPVRYHDIRLKWKFDDYGDGIPPEIKVDNIHMILQTVPGFVVTSDGFLHAYNAKIYGSFIGDVNINAGAISIKDSNNIENFKVTDQGIMTAKEANITGTITATYITANNGGVIAGFDIDGKSIHLRTLGQDGSVWMSAGSTEYANIGDSGNTNGWTFAAGSKFGVKTNGILYASEAHISGSVKITSGSIRIGNKFSVSSTGDVQATSISTAPLRGSYDSGQWAIFKESSIQLVRRDDVGGSGYDITRRLSGILFSPSLYREPMAIVYHKFEFHGNGTQSYNFEDEGISHIECAVAGCSTGSDQIDCRWSGTTVIIENNNGSCYVGVIAIGFATTYVE